MLRKLDTLFKILAYKLLLQLQNVLSFVIPKKRKRYVLFLLHDSTRLSGNLKAFALYLKNNPTLQVNFIVLNKNKKVLNEAKELGMKTKKPLLSFSWSLLRAEFVLIDSSSHPMLKNSRLNIVQLWHGVGFKNIALMNDNLSEKAKSKLKNIYSKYTLLIASSLEDQKKKKRSFGVANTVITGSPRNDVFFNNKEGVQIIKQQYNLQKYAKIIVYAPTFRDYATTPPFSGEFWKELQKYLEKENTLFAVKKHPWDKYLQVPEDQANIIDFSHTIADPQDLLLVGDILISDYSSISTDFALTGRPILIYAYDFEAYKAHCRSIYYDLEAILPQPLVKNEEELLHLLMEDNWYNQEETKKSYQQFVDVFHEYVDGNASQRVYKALQQI